MTPLLLSKDSQGKWNENGEKGKAEHLEKTKQRKRGMKADKRRGLSSAGVTPYWTHRAMTLNNLGKGFQVTWQEAAEQGGR